VDDADAPLYRVLVVRHFPTRGRTAVTDHAAYQHFEEKSKGTLEAGKLADLVILVENPLKVDPMTIKDIKVVETIKDGKTIFLRQEKPVAAAEPVRPRLHAHGAPPVLNTGSRATLGLLQAAALQAAAIRP